MSRILSEKTTSFERDVTWMQKALALAEKGRFTTSPNPRVGCVIVSADGHLVGEGFHKQAGTPHAEVHALRMAKTQTQGATAYVTLEPCSHYGRTPPCADALIAANVSRVVVAMTDPYEEVCGRGIKKLQDAGIQVDIGVCEDESQKLNRGFVKRVTKGRPFVTLKLAASLDGKIALCNGESQWITGPEARKDVQYHRAQSCAILTGSGTVIADDPSLLVRGAQAEFEDYPLDHIRQPLRVVVDSGNNIPAESKMLHDGYPVWLVNTNERPHISSDSVSQLTLPASALGKVDLSVLLDELGSKQINNLWVEGGSVLAGALLEAQLVDEVIVYQAPKIIGDKAISLVTMGELTSLSSSIELGLDNVERLGDDVKMTYRVIEK